MMAKYNKKELFDKLNRIKKSLTAKTDKIIADLYNKYRIKKRDSIFSLRIIKEDEDLIDFIVRLSAINTAKIKLEDRILINSYFYLHKKLLHINKKIYLISKLENDREIYLNEEEVDLLNYNDYFE